MRRAGRAAVGDLSPVHILATSREPLQVADERQWRVPLLVVPDLDAAPVALADLAAYPAVELFVARAQALVPAFRLSDENAVTVARICARLAGHPLAMELAAARVRVLAPAQILARLDDALRLLTGGGRRTPIRQQTLRATLDWSHELLEAPERVAFARLAVFAGGADLSAAEAVCGGPDLPPEDVLNLLARLVDKSLVLVEEAATIVRLSLIHI